MTNIFMLVIPPKNYEAMIHYKETIQERVTPDRIFRYVDADLRHTLSRIFGNKPIAVWGSRDTPNNRATFSRMRAGDDILIVEGKSIKLLGKIADKTMNPNLSKELWKNLKGDTKEGWNLIYFIANPSEIDLPFSEFNRLLGYEPRYAPYGFARVADEKLKSFYQRYGGDLYSVLQRIKSGIVTYRNEETLLVSEATEVLAVAAGEDEAAEACIDEKLLSDHIVMQYRLSRLGVKAGSKVWVPRNDQQRIRTEYRFDDFEKEFSSGIDVPARYVENIDVVWKAEFRIDAAFEIENTTAIYSGLLRFSDLKIVAPNSNYPLFVVAPIAKRNRLIDQVNRPTFRRLDFKGKVRFLPYEAVSEIDRFFEKSNSGLNVDLLIGKSEAVD
jgi:hypothetical protein